jgi:hypothetical protein
MTLMGGYFFTTAATVQIFRFKIIVGHDILQLLHLRLGRNQGAAGFAG